MPAVFAREGHALRHALVDDVDADLRQAVNVGLARAEVAALHRVVKQAVDAVAIAMIILGGVDAALRGDGVRAAGGILEAEALDVVTQLAERGCRGSAGQARPYHDDVVLALVGWVYQLEIEFVFVPDGLDRAGGDFGVEFHMLLYCSVNIPASTATGIEILPMATNQAKTAANFLIRGV